MNVKTAGLVFWALTRFLSEPLRTPIAARVWANATKAKLLDNYLRDVRTPLGTQALPREELEDMGYRPDPHEPMVPGLALNEIREQLVENSYPRSKTEPMYAKGLKGELSDWLNLTAIELEERCVSVLVAKQAVVSFRLDEVQDALGIDFKKDKLDSLARLYPGPSDLESTAQKLLDSHMDDSLVRDGSVGATSRSLWMPLAYELLESNNLWYVSYANAGLPPTSMVLSRERMSRVGWRLRLLSKTAIALSVHYDWDLSQSTSFVLTGAVPLTQAVGFSTVEEGGGPMPRFEMSVGASVSPAELAKAYIAAREHRLKGFKGIGKKHAALATFAAEFRNEGLSDWRDTMEAWNAWAVRHFADDPKATYANQALFKRDAQQAKARLLRTGDN